MDHHPPLAGIVNESLPIIGSCLRSFFHNAKHSTVVSRAVATYISLACDYKLGYNLILPKLLQSCPTSIVPDSPMPGLILSPWLSLITSIEFRHHHQGLPLWQTKLAMENLPFLSDLVKFPMKNGDIHCLEAASPRQATTVRTTVLVEVGWVDVGRSATIPARRQSRHGMGHPRGNDLILRNPYHI